MPLKPHNYTHTTHRKIKYETSSSSERLQKFLGTSLQRPGGLERPPHNFEFLLSIGKRALTFKWHTEQNSCT